MRYVIALLLAAVVGAAGYVGGYADASRQWYSINRALGRMGELDRADHLLRFVRLIDDGDPSGARLRMVAVASVMLYSDAMDIGAVRPPTVREALAERFEPNSFDYYTETFGRQNRERDTELRKALLAICSASASSPAGYNAACRR